MKLEELLANLIRWRESCQLVDRNGMTHMSMIMRDDMFFVPCQGAWVSGASYQRVEGALVTCVVCTMFVARDGRLSLWTPSS